MKVDQAVLAFAGVMVLASVALAHFVSPWWLLLTGSPAPTWCSRRSPDSARRRRSSSGWAVRLDRLSADRVRATR
jgi:hypothetical protein